MNWITTLSESTLNPIDDLPDQVPSAELESEMQFLFDRINYERTTDVSYPRHFKLESMRRLLSELGDPQNDYGIIHVAGTKGKGSTSKMIAGVLNHSGILTGVYSSPHIDSINERIVIGGKLIGDQALANDLRQVRLAVFKLDQRADVEGFRKNSFFEMISATALLHFSNEGAEKVVLEVGMGGRLDSTNVCEPELCIITNISLDHTRQLGDTIDLIAREKAGIIKRGVPIISGVKGNLAIKEIREMATINNCDLIEVGIDFHFKESESGNQANSESIQFSTWGTVPEGHRYRYQDLRLGNVGHHQIENAALAIAALNSLPDRYRVSSEALRRSMQEFSMIGRGEVLSQSPHVIVDMAHNVASASALADRIQRIKQNHSVRRLIFATSRDKDLAGMLELLLPHFDDVVFTQFVENPRAAKPNDILKVAQEIAGRWGGQRDSKLMPTMQSQETPELAWRTVQPKVQDNDLLCVAGSAFLVAELRPLLLDWLSESDKSVAG